MFSQPENLSKDRLKAELKKLGIPHSPGKTKEYYVRIYQDSVIGGSTRPRLRPRSEFSSDEETISKRLSYQQQSRGKQYTKVLNVEHFTRQISDYSDSQLSSELRKHGIDAGPITATTRVLYQKKLAKTMLENTKKVPISQSSSGVTVASESDNELSSEYEKEDVDLVQRPTYVKQSQKPAVTPTIPATAYNFRPRPSATKPFQKPVNVNPPQKPVIVPRGDNPAKPITTPITTTTSSTTTAPIRPYSATWCNVRLFANLFILLLVFIVAVIGFDYMLYGKSRVVEWLLVKYPALANIATQFS